MSPRKRASGRAEPDPPDIPENLGAPPAPLDLASGPFECVLLERLDLSGRRTTSVRFAQFQRVRFERCQLTEGDFYGAMFEAVVFVETDLAGAMLAEATFTSSELRGCNLTGVANPERLRGVGMRWDDIVASAGELGRAAGIHLLDDTTQ